MITRKISILILVVLGWSAFTTLQAQERSEDNKIGIGGAITLDVPHGIRLDAGVRIIPELSIRAGVSFLPNIQPKGGRVQEVDLSTYKETLGYTPELHAKGQVSSLAGQLMLDYHPFRSGFRITAGMFIKGPRGTVQALLIDPSTGRSIMESPEQNLLNPNNMPVITFQLVNNNDNPIAGEAVSFQPSADASMALSLDIGSSIQPYVGIGYGYAVPRSRVSFILDVGALFSGGMKFSSPNAIKGDPNILLKLHKTAMDIDYYTRILPILNLGVAIRIF